MQTFKRPVIIPTYYRGYAKEVMRTVNNNINTHIFDIYAHR